MAKRGNIGDELIASMEDAVAILRGDVDAARVHLAPDLIDIRASRDRLRLSWPAFAARFGLPEAIVREWEQALRRLDQAARVLLLVIARTPELVAEAVAEAKA